MRFAFKNISALRDAHEHHISDERVSAASQVGAHAGENTHAQICSFNDSCNFMRKQYKAGGLVCFAQAGNWTRNADTETRCGLGIVTSMTKILGEMLKVEAWDEVQ